MKLPHTKIQYYKYDDFFFIPKYECMITSLELKVHYFYWGKFELQLWFGKEDE